MEDISMLINGGKISVKKKVSKTPRKSLSKEYKSFCKNLKKNLFLIQILKSSYKSKNCKSQ